MKEIYLIRHAQAETNLLPHIIGGRSNHARLTDFGVEQAKKLGINFKKINIKPDFVYTSGAVRTNSTAEISLREAGIKIDLVESEELQELHQGDGTGKEKKEIYNEQAQEQIQKLGKDFKLPKGESMNDVSLRMYSWFENNIKNHEGNVFLAYTHGVAIKCFLADIEDWPHRKVFETLIENASITKIKFDNGYFSIEYISKTDF